MTEWVVSKDETGTRLDKFLAAADRLGSRSRAVTALERGKVFLNARETTIDDAGTRLSRGDGVRVWMDRPGTARRRIEHVEGVRIAYEDDWLIVVDKPAGLLAVPLERRRDEPSVYDILVTHLRARRRRPLVVHRIDRDTSGLVVFAKDAGTQQRLRAQFKAREPERVYLAVCYGRPDPDSGTWRDFLVWDQSALIQKETHPKDPKGKEAVSEYRTIEVFANASLLEIRLRTGKRNQIRLQARLRGHTLVGEQRYTFGPDTLRPVSFKRQALHASRLSFRHPATGTTLRFDAPMPSDLSELIDRLRKRAAVKLGPKRS